MIILSQDIDAALHPTTYINVTRGLQGVGLEIRCLTATTTGTLYPAANRALYVPFVIWRNFTVNKLAVLMNNTASGNFDLGIFNYAGVPLVSTGSTSSTVTGAFEIIDVTDTVLTPGQHWMGVTFDNTTARITSYTFPGSLGNSWGMRQQAAVSPGSWPNPIVPAFAASAVWPILAILGAQF